MSSSVYFEEKMVFVKSVSAYLLQDKKNLNEHFLLSVLITQFQLHLVIYLLVCLL